MNLEEYRRLVETSDEEIFFEKTKDVPREELERLDKEYIRVYVEPKQKLYLRKDRLSVIFLVAIWLSLFFVYAHLTDMTHIDTKNAPQVAGFVIYCILFVVILCFLSRRNQKSVEKIDIADVYNKGFEPGQKKINNETFTPNFNDKLMFFFVIPLLLACIVLPVVFTLSYFAPYPFYEAPIKTQIIMSLVFCFIIFVLFIFNSSSSDSSGFISIQKYLQWKNRNK